MFDGEAVGGREELCKFLGSRRNCFTLLRYLQEVLVAVITIFLFLVKRCDRRAICV
jgi:hypothetical protein